MQRVLGGFCAWHVCLLLRDALRTVQKPTTTCPRRPKDARAKKEQRIPDSTNLGVDSGPEGLLRRTQPHQHRLHRIARVGTEHHEATLMACVRACERVSDEEE